MTTKRIFEFSGNGFRFYRKIIPPFRIADPHITDNIYDSYTTRSVIDQSAVARSSWVPCLSQTIPAQRILSERLRQTLPFCDYIIKINPATMINQIPIPVKIPFWTRLFFKQCECCTLTEKQSPHCPIATNIAGLVETFKHHASFDKCQVTCKVPERMYVKETNVQTGLFSIYGLINATSTCPIMGFFKPMARFHLPFASIEETITRIAAYYLLGQYFERKMGNCVDMELKVLDEYIEKVALVDEGIIGRLRDITEKDADRNAFTMLHSMATILSLGINEKLEDYESLFAIRQKK